MQRILSHPFIFSLLIIGVLMFVNHQGWLKSVKGVTLGASAHFQQGISNTFSQFNNLTKALFCLPELMEENQNLKQANLSLLSDMALLGEVLKENDFLRQQTQVEIAAGQEYILADIVGQNLTQLDQIVFISKGTAHGLSQGDVVITAGNVLVGRIVEIYSHYAKVRLITDSNSQVNALIQENQVSGLVIGQGKKELLFDLLPQGENIEEDQTVMTSAAANLFPKGFLIGKVKEVISLDAQISQKALVEPVFKIGDLKKVLILINFK